MGCHVWFKYGVLVESLRTESLINRKYILQKCIVIRKRQMQNVYLSAEKKWVYPILAYTLIGHEFEMHSLITSPQVQIGQIWQS